MIGGLWDLFGHLLYEQYNVDVSSDVLCLCVTEMPVWLFRLYVLNEMVYFVLSCYQDSRKEGIRYGSTLWDKWVREVHTGFFTCNTPISSVFTGPVTCISYSLAIKLFQ